MITICCFWRLFVLALWGFCLFCRSFICLCCVLESYLGSVCHNTFVSKSLTSFPIAAPLLGDTTACLFEGFSGSGSIAKNLLGCGTWVFGVSFSDLSQWTSLFCHLRWKPNEKLTMIFPPQLGVSSSFQRKIHHLRRFLKVRSEALGAPWALWVQQVLKISLGSLPRISGGA